MRCSTLWSSV